MRKIVSLIIVSIILITFAIPAFAASDIDIQPRYTYIHYVTTDIQIDQSTGIATCNGHITAQLSVPVELHVKLQVKKNGVWQTLATRVANNVQEAYVYFQYKVEKGYDYKVVTNAYAYNTQGILMESHVVSDFAYYSAS